MSRLPLRLRVTLAFAAAMAVVLAVLGVAVYALFEDRLLDNVDQNLRSRAADISALVERRGPSLPDAGSTSLIESEESFVQLLGEDGRLLDGTARVEGAPLLSVAEVRRAAADGTLILPRGEGAVEEGDPVRLLATTVEAEGETVTVVVGQAMDDNEETLTTLRVLLLAGLPVALLLASLAGYAVAAASLRPVEAMRRKAAAVSEDSPGERLPVSPAGDEIGRLGETLNEMLARLETAIQHERAFVADASHELRTPLAILKTELELALRAGRSEDELREALRSASDETDRLARLADDLLVLARSDRGQLPLRRERVGAGELLDGVAGRFRAAGHEVVVDAADGLVVAGDRLRLEQALGNLVSNGVTHGEAPVTLSARRVGSTVELHVSDVGPGLSAEFAPLAFERFTRADSARTGGGAGLGLAIVQAIAIAHGGRAAADGNDVWIELPDSHADLITGP